VHKRRGEAECERMCQPSASSAIEWNVQPVVISTTIITAVRPLCEV
jgi:hypothetical protein